MYFEIKLMHRLFNPEDHLCSPNEEAGVDSLKHGFTGDLS